ncbi:MAG: transcription-repair coupling factor [Alphaproteobacteria bacterium]
MTKKIYSSVPFGFEPFILSREVKQGGILYIAANEKQLDFMEKTLALICPKVQVFSYPNWDTVPYDRISPSTDIVGEQIATLTKLPTLSKNEIVLTTVSAFMQRLPPLEAITNNTLALTVGKSVSMTRLIHFLSQNGYQSTDVVAAPGEFAVRGEIVDIYPAGFTSPVRLDFFDDELESTKLFNPATQRTTGDIGEIVLRPVRLFQLTPETQTLFRSRYRDLLKAGSEDAFYQAVSTGQFISGLEHFLPLFYDKMLTLGDVLLDDTRVFLAPSVQEAITSRAEQIQEYFEARQQALREKLDPNGAYYPIAPSLMFLSPKETENLLAQFDTVQLTPFYQEKTLDQGGRAGHDFMDVRIQQKQDIFEAVADFISSGVKPVIVSVFTEGAGQRLSALLKEKGVALKWANTWAEALKRAPSLIVAPFESGFQTDDFLILSETDMFGERMQSAPKRRRSQDFIGDISTLSAGDLVVHQTHGIGRFMGLQALTLAGAPHDCLCLEYADNAKLFVPVENADVLSRYGSSEVALDKLGSSSFAGRKEKVKKDLLVMADKLIGIASERAVNKMPKLLAPHGFYQEFCAGFPYVETEDQLKTMAEIETDLAKGQPMDRLVCGDVGFGKTEIAMRAAFLAVMNGMQVAMVAPTTLLARQHAENFAKRFKGFPVRIGSLSRLVNSADTKRTKEGLEAGGIDIVVGTHALLNKNIRFKNLGLVIIDEEQHFGVAHKERLKELKAGVHVLTLTATPIPRTLQLSLSGVRELSIIATPPVDRLAVKTYVMPFDPVVIKEAILREHFRAGQSFVVVPRISDMDEVYDKLHALLPDLKIVKAHGQMAPSELEKIMSAFMVKHYDILLATSIVESGLDIPAVNTIVIYRADMFGLAGLYQLRGRVGRSKKKAYAYLTTTGSLSDNARKRLEVMQKLDSLGAGFMLASHDLDIRGAGNLLGQEQSGHIREVGVALYQKMLKEAVGHLRQQKAGEKPLQEDWSPQIQVGLPVLISDKYIPDLGVRMDLYRRLSELTTLNEINAMREELKDRFGLYPQETENLFLTLELKLLAKQAHIERVDAGDKGATISFYQNTFPNPAGLIDYIQSQVGTMKIRPDQKVVVMRPWGDLGKRLTGVRDMIARLAAIATGK